MTSQTHDTPPPAPIDPSTQLLQMVQGFWVSAMLSALARLGVPDHLADGARTAEELAGLTQTHAPTLYRLLRGCATAGLLTEAPDGTFRLTPTGQLLRRGVPGSLRGYALGMIAPGHWLPWIRLHEAVRSGQSVARDALGQDIWDYLATHPEEGTHFAEAMGDLSAMAGGEVVRAYDVSGFQRIVDVGGSNGVLLAGLLDKAPAARGVILDLPSVVAGARAEMLRRGLAERVEVVGGDFFQAVPEGDLHLLKLILHDWDDARAVELLRQCRRASRPGGKLLIIELLVPSEPQPSPVALLDLTMLVMLGGRERTREEFEVLLREAGYRLERVLPTHSPFFLLEATPT
ncbi:methyltransferase [Myxococcaceae bacterium GXIMD 01537]